MSTILPRPSRPFDSTAQSRTIAIGEHVNERLQARNAARPRQRAESGGSPLRADLTCACESPDQGRDDFFDLPLWIEPADHPRSLERIRATLPAGRRMQSAPTHG